MHENASIVRTLFDLFSHFLFFTFCFLCLSCEDVPFDPKNPIKCDDTCTVPKKVSHVVTFIAHYGDCRLLTLVTPISIRGSIHFFLQICKNAFFGFLGWNARAHTPMRTLNGSQINELVVTRE